ncbi:hypothetical protein E8E14_011236 [Neopestalotiopsis sp. 37M]|nr:hypothetical protein E8E14_011236 [Neopestalotiopsis sp. 37M]
MSTTNDAENLFQEAARSFRDSLSPSDSKELTEFASAKEMIQELNKRVSSYQKKSRLVGFCQRLERVSESLSPFFDIIGIFIQSNPEVPALIWGAIRMVFLLASNFSSFLDKLLAMFEKIGDRLPGYAEYYRRVLDRHVFGQSGLANPKIDIKKIPKFESTRVLKVLSYIYKDLLQFCQEACRLFDTKRRGVRHTSISIADIFWKPFDARFKNILERIETHQALFLGEIQLEESKYTEYQFRKRQSDSDHTNEAISQVKEQVSELRQTILEREETLTVRFETISEHITFRQIAKWINASDFSRGLNKAQEVRLDRTGKWFLASPSYKNFKSLEIVPVERGSEPTKLQIMLIQGKPGYGKTILSSLLIEDLARPSETGSSGGLQVPTTLPVFYYHFASERVEECSPMHGIRACLHQIVHRNKKDANVLDAVSIIAETDGTGQVHATDEEIRQCLLLLLLQLPPVTLVFDGLDECTDPSDIFRTVYELCCRTGTKAIFLGRPSCKPPRGCNSYTAVSLEPWQNFNDIQMYLRPEIECLKDDELLPESKNVDDIVTRLAERAQGMFLWARLVVRYLSNAWLSPGERADAISDDTMLDGLENLYGKIIAILERGPTTQQEKVHRIFQVIATSRTPFTLEELRQIVAVKVGQVTLRENLIVDFQNCLPVMCGALVECDSAGHVHFIHSSFRDYVSESKYLHGSPLAITKQSSWLTLTTICLSYLTYDIPVRSFAATVLPSKRRKMIAEYFPLLRYGVHWIQQHDPEIFHSSLPIVKGEVDTVNGVLQALAGWIKQNFCVTAWIEANFTFQQPPTLEPLISMINIWLLRYDALHTQADRVLSLYLRLEADLHRLRSDWTEVLLREPCAIWTSTITAFTKSSFWASQEDTIVTHLGERLPNGFENDTLDNRATSAILLKSQTAADKKTHSTIYVIPSSHYIHTARRMAALGPESRTPLSSMEKDDLAYMSSNWQVQYQIQGISSLLPFFSGSLKLPTDDVFEILKMPIDTDDRRPRAYQFIKKAIELLSFEDDVWLRFAYWEKPKDDGVPEGAREVPDSEEMAPPMQSQKIMISSLRDASRIHRGNLQGFDSHISGLELTATQPEEGLTITKHDESLQIAKGGHTGQTLKITSVDGRTAQFGHIPSLQSWEPSSLTILPITDSVKVIWDKESQKDYSITDVMSAHLPCIIERTILSVPFIEQSYSGNSEMSITADSGGHSRKSLSTKKHLRTGEDGVEGVPSKRAK